MKRINMSWLWVFGMVLGLSAAEIRNGGFEEGVKSFEGVGWWWFSNAETCDFDSQVVHAGKRSIRLSVKEGGKSLNDAHWTGAATLMGPVKDPKPNTLYTLRCWMRTDMTRGTAGVAVRPQRKKMAMTDWMPVKFMPVRRSLGEWTELVYTFKTPQNMTHLAIYAAVENFQGQAWFDDFRIEEGCELPAVPQSQSFDQALLLNHFICIGEGSSRREEPKAQTEMRLISKGDRLLIRGFCHEPDMKSIAAKPRQRDGAVWKDDSVEIFIDAQRSRSSYYQFVVNADGALYDAYGSDSSWSPSGVRVRAQRLPRAWSFELSIPYTAIGYGLVEATLPDKQMGMAFFRNRKSGACQERSSWPLWKVKGFYGNPPNYQPVRVGAGQEAANFHFLTRGASQQTMRPPLAWQTSDPLYEELMGDEPMHRPGETIGFCNFGRMMAPGPGVIAFCLQHGMKYHYDELAALTRSMRLALPAGCFPSGGVDPQGKSPQVQRQRKYGLTLSVNPMMQFGGAHYVYESRPQAPMFKHFAGAWFYPDPRVQRSFATHAKKLLTAHKDEIDELVLGHEGRFLYFTTLYDEIRAAYLKEDPDTWKRFEDQARKSYGYGRFGFPKSHASATPWERMVYQRFVLTEYNKAVAALVKELRAIKPTIRLVSELDTDGIKPYLYEQNVGAYDYMCQQMPWGGGASRQNLAYHCKILGDLAETPARGGAHIEHYFVSLNPEEVNEVLSSVFRVGGEALQLWLIDWFGKTMGDYHGAPDRLHEIVNVFHHYGRMRKLKFPKPDTAIFYANASQLARSWALTGGVGGGHEEAFTVLGPAVRSWFRFVSDTQLQLGRRSLSEFKVLYDTGSEYLEEQDYVRLVDYVRQGGVLVCGSPTAFRWRLDGTQRDTSRLLGVTCQGVLKHSGDARPVSLPDFPRVAQLGAVPGSDGHRLALVPQASVGVLAQYGDKTPALVVHALGKGKVLVFSGNPFVSSIFGSSGWKRFFSALQQDLGCAVNRDIWRFRFPRAKTPPPSQIPEGLQCLTGNSWYWVTDTPTEGPNLHLPFRRSYDREPDLIPDSLAKDKLFNRKASMTAEPLNHVMTLKETVNPWCVAWRKGAPVTMTLTFPRKVEVQQVRIWLHGDIPAVTVRGKKGQKLQALATATCPPHEKTDVRQLEIIVEKCQTDSLEIEFGQRKLGDLYVAELEVWGRN